MIGFPALPAWSDLHPAVIHFPIALLLVAPVFVLVGALMRDRGRAFLIAALALMILGTGGVWLAVATGEAAGEITESMPGMKPVVEQHEEWAEVTRAAFSVLTVLFAMIVALPLVLRRTNLVTATIAPLLFLVFYAAGALILANTAHEGGRLVHELGSSPAIAAAQPAVQPAADDD